MSDKSKWPVVENEDYDRAVGPLVQKCNAIETELEKARAELAAKKREFRGPEKKPDAAAIRAELVAKWEANGFLEPHECRIARVHGVDDFIPSDAVHARWGRTYQVAVITEKVADARARYLEATRELFAGSNAAYERWQSECSRVRAESDAVKERITEGMSEDERHLVSLGWSPRGSSVIG